MIGVVYDTIDDTIHIGDAEFPRAEGNTFVVDVSERGEMEARSLGLLIDTCETPETVRERIEAALDVPAEDAADR